MNDSCRVCEESVMEPQLNDLPTGFHRILSRLSCELSANIHNMNLLRSCMSGVTCRSAIIPKTPGEFSGMSIPDGLSYIEDLIMTETSMISEIRDHFGMNEIKMIIAEDLLEDEAQKLCEFTKK